MNFVNVPHSHLESSEHFCVICVDHEKREMAQMFRSVVTRIKIAQQYGDEFIFDREDGEVTSRVHLYAQWMDLRLYHRGFEFGEVDEIAEAA